MLLEHEAPLAEKSFSPQTTAFITGSLDSTFCVWNVAGQRQTPGELRLCFDEYIPGVTLHAWSYNEQQLALTLGDGLEIQIFDVEHPLVRDEWDDYEPLYTMPVLEAPLLSLNFVGENGNHLLTFDLNETVTLFEIENEEIITRLEASNVAISPDRTIIAVMTFDEDLRLIDADNGETLTTLATDAEEMLFSPDGNWLATWDDDIELWDLQRTTTRRPETQIDVQSDNVQFTPDSRFLATWEGENIRLWDVDSGANTGLMEEHLGGVRLLAFGVDSTRAISVNTQGFGRLWRITDEGDAVELAWLDGEIDDISISPDSYSAMTTRQDFALRFWNVETGQIRGQYDLPPATIISPDWTLLAINYGELVVWHGRNDDPRTFDWMPIGMTTGIANVRPTPSQELPRFAALPAGTEVFALGISPDEEWLYIQLADGQRGWVQVNILELASGQSNLNNLPEIEVES
jgi:WD40 repeat protein